MNLACTGAAMDLSLCKNYWLMLSPVRTPILLFALHVVCKVLRCGQGFSKWTMDKSLQLCIMVRGKCVIFLNHEWNGNLSLSLPLQNMSKFVLHKTGNTTKLKTIGFFHWPLWQCRVNSLHADLIFHYKLLSWAELSLMYRLWNQSRVLWFATRAGAVTTWPTCDNPLFTLNCQNYIWL